jgi:ABC-2 type transport system ATP-binding protein
MSSKAILIQDLVKKYDGNKTNSSFLALDHLNLSVPKGSIFGLLGPNGAGKSTLINILAGTVVMTQGKVSILDVDITEFPKKAKSLIGIVPQEIVFDTFFPIEQALEFTAGYFGVPKKDRKTAEILKALGLWDKRKNFPQQLSGGMKRRFLIAKAMVHSPKVLILDEPTAGVDIDLRNQLWHYVIELNRQGMTIIITTHYLAEAQELCDEIAFINKGKIIKQDTKENLLSDLGTRHIEVEFSNDINNIDFQIQSGFQHEIISDNKVRFQINSESSNYTDLLQKISSTGLEVKNITTYQPDLEKIFHKIIKTHD